MVDGINNIASQIFAKLDSQDSKGTDNKIEASIWNKFVSDKGGKEISNYISKESAVKSIVHYLTNMSKKVGCTVEELANQWLGKSEANPSEISGEKSKLNSKSVDIPANVARIMGDSYTEEDEATFDKGLNDAMQLISDIANNKYKYTISEDIEETGDKFKTIELKDGRSIELSYEKDEQGKYKLSSLSIDTGTNYNSKHGFVIFNCKDSQCWSDGQIGFTSQKDFQDLLKVISGIIGEDVKV